MKKIKIKAPVNSLQSAKMQIAAGAEEIYLSYSSNDINALSFSGRGKESFNKIKTQMRYEEFQEIIEFAHQHNVFVDLAANVPMSGNSENPENSFHKKYLEYVERAIQAGVDGVIVGDLGNLYMLQDYKNKICLTAGVFFGTLNCSQIELLENLGAKKVCLPHHFSIKEIADIVKKSNIDVEIFGHFGCSFIESTCSLYHHASEEIDFGIPCRAKYCVRYSKKLVNILDMGEDCSLCQMDQILKTGITSIKIIGRELDCKLSSTITYVYNFMLQKLYEGMSIQDTLSLIKKNIDFSFWQKNFCDVNRCKYVNSQYYI